VTLAAGSRLGHYEIVAHIGAGGMGEVYRARDSKLDRDVAIKVLRADVAGDRERLARFDREARILAALNHPNIANVIGLEDATDRPALVMELVEGPTLALRIDAGALPLDEALDIARQIAEALEAAHDRGIIHRDLKPANVKIRPDGLVKVLDFGLAKALDPTDAQALSDQAASPTITSPAMTTAGVILGTAAYMAPEQAKGKPVDRRADVWALGAVLYEMLTGQRAFHGEDTTDTIVAVLSQEPDWSSLPADTPVPIRRMMRRCLQKDRRRRLDSAAAVRLEIDDALSGAYDTAVPTVASGTRARAVLPWAVAAASAVVLAAVLLAWAPWRSAPVASETRLDVVTPGTDALTSFALSPDGRQIVFAAAGDGGVGLWLRDLAVATARPLPGTEGATFPFWSPDGRSIGFFAGGAMKRLDLGGGAAQTLARAPVGRGGAWHEDGTIFFSADQNSPILRVAATGGDPVVVTRLAPQQRGHRWPHLLPSGRELLYYAVGTPEGAGVFLKRLDSDTPILLTRADSDAVYLPSGWLLWVRRGTLVAQRLDLAQSSLSGDQVTVADGVAVAGLARSAVSVAATGTVAYRLDAAGRRQLTWVDRRGAAVGTIGPPDANDLSNPRIAPDGHRVAVSRRVESNTDIWLLDRSRTSRVTFSDQLDSEPVWSPDGTRLAFASTRAFTSTSSGQVDLYQTRFGAGGEELLLASGQTKTPNSWSPDGRFFMYFSTDPQTGNDLWVLPVTGSPAVFLKTRFSEGSGVFSPDGRWVAYMSDQSGRMEVYVRPFVPAAGRELQVSTDGGIHPAWSPDGTEVYYLNPEGAMMAAPVTVTGSTVEPGTPVRLFPTRIFGGGIWRGESRQYDVAPDGRFLINTMLDDDAAPITLLMNWNPEPIR